MLYCVVCCVVLCYGVWCIGHKPKSAMAFSLTLSLNLRCIPWRQVRNAARVIGDPTLYRKMEATSHLIKRDIVFAASLYVA